MPASGSRASTSRASTGWTRAPVYRDRARPEDHGHAAGRRRRHPQAAAGVRLGQGRARVAALSRYAGDRHRRARRRRRCGRTSDRLSLIDAEGRGARPGAGRADARPAAADRQGRQCARRVTLETLLDKAPSLKAQLVSATWVGQRRWDLSFQSGETVALPEGEAAARRALARFAKMDKSAGLARPRHRPLRPAHSRQDDRPPAARARRADRSRTGFRKLSDS